MIQVILKKKKMFNITNHQGNKSNADVTLYLSEWLLFKNKKKECWWGWCREKETFMHIGGNVNWWNYYEKQYGVSSKNKNRIKVWPNNFTSEHVSEEEDTNLNICTPVFIEALFVIAKIWKQVPNRRWMDKEYVLYIPHLYI